MGQEFHVLRCFSCQTFQVQQVKKEKKWSCKMCGEKQSLIKEYGRGSGADCRRHVQKLNSLRGELLDVEQERTWAQWENQESGNEDDIGEEDQSCEQQGDLQAVSRWSKYMDQTGVGLKDEEHEGDEENIYTERARFRSCGKISKKRKKSFTLKNALNTCDEDEDEDETGTDPAHWRAKKPFQARQSGSFFRLSSAVEHSSKVSPFINTSPKSSAVHTSPSASVSSKHIDVYTDTNAVGVYTGANEAPSYNHHSSVPATTSQNVYSFCQKSTKSRQEAEGSKWTRFISSASVEEDKDETEVDTCAQVSSQGNNAKVAGSPSAASPGMSISTVAHTNTGHLSGGGHVCSRAPGLEPSNRSKSVLEKLSQCMTRTASNSSTFASKAAGPQSPVCLQQPPMKKRSPVFSFHTLFHTDEDFDDSF